MCRWQELDTMYKLVVGYSEHGNDNSGYMQRGVLR
jgi:hypothetical protein